MPVLGHRSLYSGNLSACLGTIPDNICQDGQMACISANSAKHNRGGQHPLCKDSHLAYAYSELIYQVGLPCLTFYHTILTFSSVVRSLDLKTRGCGFDSQAGQPNNY